MTFIHFPSLEFTILIFPDVLFVSNNNMCFCRTHGGVHIHEDQLTVTSPALMWVKVNLPDHLSPVDI